MKCGYCDVALRPGSSRCAGCGAPSDATFAEPAGTAATIYEQIGRAVVNREPHEALDRMLRVGERKNASTREQKIARWAKAIFFVAILWKVPWILIPILSFGSMFLLWVYLPYRGVKAVLGWLSE